MLKQLHTADSECSTYAVQLMDKLENEKAQNATNDAVVDDVAAKAYIENFALETFKRAEDAQRNDKVSIQTADTFQAASTFLDLLNIWGELDQEAAAKSKFAKYHAMRILKAVKAGEDPNAMNPVVEEVAAVPPPPPDEEVEAELKEMENQANGGQQSVQTTAPTSSSDEHPSDLFQDANSTQQLTPQAHTDRQLSIGGGYFPTLPGEPSVDMSVDDAVVPTISPPPQDISSQLGAQGPQSGPDALPPAPSAFSNPQTSFSPDSQTPLSFSATNMAGPDPHMPTQPSQPSFNPPPAATLPSFNPPPVAAVPSVAPPSSVPPVQPRPGVAYRTDDEATMAAQKHARWAISALNFEDVNTAVKELLLALQSLGAV